MSLHRSSRVERTATDSSNREQDFYAWVLEQARRIRVNQPETVDWQGLATELDDLTLRTRHELLGHLEEVFIHLLKLQYERSDNQRRRNEWQWKVHLAEHRNRINDLLDDSRTLRNMFDDFKRKAYPRACKRAKLAMGLAGEFPLEPPWTDEKLLDDSFFPAAQRLHP